MSLAQIAKSFALLLSPNGPIHVYIRDHWHCSEKATMEQLRSYYIPNTKKLNKNIQMLEAKNFVMEQTTKERRIYI